MFSRSLNQIPSRRAPVILRIHPVNLNASVSNFHTITRPHNALRFELKSHLKHGSRVLIPLQVRGAASNVAGRPASQTPQHAAQNIKEEVGHAASDFAKNIAGANFNVDNVRPINETFVSYKRILQTQST